MRHLDPALRRFANTLAAAGLCLLFLNAIATVLDVLGRFLFSAPIDRLSDVSMLVYILAAACCVPAATSQRRHITIRPFEGKCPPRVYAAIEAFASALLLLVWLVLAHQLWRHTSELHAVRQTLSQLPIEVAPFWLAVALAMSFNALLEALNLWRLLGTVLGLRPPELGASADATLL